MLQVSTRRISWNRFYPWSWYACACLLPRLLITTHMRWNRLTISQTLYIALAINIMDGYSLGNKFHYTCQTRWCCITQQRAFQYLYIISKAKQSNLAIMWVDVHLVRAGSSFIVRMSTYNNFVLLKVLQKWLKYHVPGSLLIWHY